jgi:hypothetical protein
MMAMELRKTESWSSHPNQRRWRREIWRPARTYPDGRHDDLVNGDPLGKCDNAASGCALSARAKGEPVFEILVPATNDGT